MYRYIQNIQGVESYRAYGAQHMSEYIQGVQEIAEVVHRGTGHKTNSWGDRGRLGGEGVGGWEGGEELLY